MLKSVSAMRIPQQYIIPFYKNLGILFYAFAAADKTVREQEIKTLQALVSHNWLTDDLVAARDKMNAKNALLRTFDWLLYDKEYNAETCYTNFLSFRNNHQHLFTDQINSLIMKTAGKITSSFSGRNKSELIMLAKLDLELKK